MAMEIILLEKIRNLGDLGEIVQVANGYARNYLIPQKKAMRATPDAMREVEERRRLLAAEEGKRLESAKAKADLIPREIRVTRLVSDSGTLYGSVSPADIIDAIAEAGATVAKPEITLPDGPIKHPGEHNAEIILHPEVQFSVKVMVVGESKDGETVTEADAETKAEANDNNDENDDDNATDADGDNTDNADAAADVNNAAADAQSVQSDKSDAPAASTPP